MNNFRNPSRPTPQELHLGGGCRFLQRANQMPLATSAFTIGLLDVEGVKHVLMVMNSEEVRPDGSVKPAGWGIPGGGIKEGENPSAAATREFQAETGLDAASPKWERYEHNLLEAKPGGGFAYHRCHIPISDYTRIERQTLIHVFTADVIWNGPVAELFGERHAESPFGSLVVELTKEDGERLGIEEAKTGEIVALGLFPLDELLDFERPHDGFYKVHLNRIRLALEPYMARVCA